MIRVNLDTANARVIRRLPSADVKDFSKTHTYTESDASTSERLSVRRGRTVFISHLDPAWEAEHVAAWIRESGFFDAARKAEDAGESHPRKLT